MRSAVLAILVGGCVFACGTAPGKAFRAQGTALRAQGIKWPEYIGIVEKPTQVAMAGLRQDGTQSVTSINLTFTFGVEEMAVSRDVWLMFDMHAAKGSTSKQSYPPTNTGNQAQIPAQGAAQNTSEGTLVLNDGSAYVQIVTPPLPTDKDAVPAPVVPPRWPVLITQYIGLGAEGTKFIVQNDQDPEHLTQRVFLLEGKLHIGDLAGNHDMVVLDTVGYYVEASINPTTKVVTIANQEPVPEDGELAAFVKDMTDRWTAIQAP